MAAKEKAPMIGTIEWFRPGEYERVERVLEGVQKLGIVKLRTGFSWADYHTELGRRWYAWLMPRLAREVEVLPCFTYTPPSRGIEPKTSSPPREPKDYADFIDVAITELGEHFEWVELWDQPNNLSSWDWRMDPDWEIFRRMLSMAAYWCHQRGKKTVLGGMCPTDPVWLDLLARHEVLLHIDAVGVHGFPGTWEHDWTDWNVPLSKVRTILQWHGLNPEVWITSTGGSTWQTEFAQLNAFARVLEAPVERVYWYSAEDLHPDLPAQDGFHTDERHYHFGLFQFDGRPKLLSRLLADEGTDSVRTLAKLGASFCAHDHVQGSPYESFRNGNGRVSNGHPPTNGESYAPGNGSTKTNGKHRAENGHSPSVPRRRDYVLITGGAGFIGTNVAARLLEQGQRVRIFDSLARPGVEKNVEWLCSEFGNRVELQLDDIRNRWAVREAVKHADRIFHFAAQVAVTTSVDQPREDFEVNVLGTFNLLEALRQLDSPPPLLFTSTNKVYGSLLDIGLTIRGNRYQPTDEMRAIGEDRPLDFESPYGCSKGAADEYVIDFSRIFGLPNVVFRMSCIYGPHQFGTEDQGWVAHFLIRALRDEKIIIYGDGKQVRDLLFVDDLVNAMLAAMESIDRIKGRAFNIGGGIENAVSLMDVLDTIEQLHGERPEVSFQNWRPGDQRYYVSSYESFQQETGWKPTVDAREGIARLHQWLASTRTAKKSEVTV